MLNMLVILKLMQVPKVSQSEKDEWGEMIGSVNELNVRDLGCFPFYMFLILDLFLHQNYLWILQGIEFFFFLFLLNEIWVSNKSLAV